MDKIMPIVNWVIANKEQMIVGYLALVGLVSWVVKLTPTLKDDNIILPIIKFLGKYIAINKTVNDSERPK